MRYDSLVYHVSGNYMRVAYQGKIGSFSSMTARALYGDDIHALETTRFRDIFEAVQRSEADIGVVPIENAIS